MKEFKLDNHPKISTGFTTPEDYFDTVSDRIQERIKTKESKIISLLKTNKILIYSVAAMLVFALCIPFFIQKTNKVSQLDHAVIEDYISYSTKMTTYELAEFLDKEDIEKLRVDFNIQDDVLEESLLNNINVENYIIN